MKIALFRWKPLLLIITSPGTAVKRPAGHPLPAGVRHTHNSEGTRLAQVSRRGPRPQALLQPHPCSGTSLMFSNWAFHSFLILYTNRVCVCAFLCVCWGGGCFEIIQKKIIKRVFMVEPDLVQRRIYYFFQSMDSRSARETQIKHGPQKQW